MKIKINRLVFIGVLILLIGSVASLKFVIDATDTKMMVSDGIRLSGVVTPDGKMILCKNSHNRICEIANDGYGKGDMVSLIEYKGEIMTLTSIGKLLVKTGLYTVLALVPGASIMLAGILISIAETFGEAIHKARKDLE